jgi:sporulation protein YlmC with PRC-barrel domain
MTSGGVWPALLEVARARHGHHDTRQFFRRPRKSARAPETDNGHVARDRETGSCLSPEAGKRSDDMMMRYEINPLKGRRRAGLRRRLFLPLALVLPLTLVANSQAVAQKPTVLVVVDVRVVALGYRVTQLIGRSVTNPAGETVGKIDDFIIQRDKVLMTILSVGGFLGIGDRKIAIPYASLVVAPNRIVLPGATKQAVARLPQFQYR